jgi:hypothetical protein
MDNLPEVPLGGGRAELSSFLRARLTHDASKAEIEVFRHRLAAAVLREKDIADTEALSDAIGIAFDEEMAFLRHGQAAAGNSAAGMEILGRKLEIFDTLTNRRITRRFS